MEFYIYHNAETQSDFFLHKQYNAISQLTTVVDTNYNHTNYTTYITK